jgi:formate-dependent nitrite reductase membrane component NrfD
VTTSYYGRPVIKEPEWKPEVGWYFFTGGLAGGSAVLALGARAAGNRPLARTATLVSAAAVNVSPVLLIKDLGRPERFLNMLRIAKLRSPMSVGSWLLAASGGVTTIAAGCELLGVLPRLRAATQVASAATGLGLSTYTAVLIADTSVPVWFEARRELPFVFAGSAAASAGAASVLLTPAEAAGPARRLALLGAAGALVSMTVMEHRLGWLAEPYHRGRPHVYLKLAKTALGAGAVMTAAGSRRRALLARLGSSLMLAGVALERFAVLRAGNESARDPRYTIEPQRARLDASHGRAVRSVT